MKVIRWSLCNHINLKTSIQEEPINIIVIQIFKARIKQHLMLNKKCLEDYLTDPVIQFINKEKKNSASRTNYIRTSSSI